MAEHPPIPNNGAPDGPELPIAPEQDAPAPEELPAELQFGLKAVYHRAADVPVGYDQQVLSAAAHVMAAAGQANSASRQALGREHRRIRLPLAAGVAVSLAMVVGAWVLLSTTGGLGGRTFTGGAADSLSTKDGTMLIGKASPRDAAPFGRGAGSGGATRKEAATSGVSDTLRSADADGSGGPRQHVDNDVKLRLAEPAGPGQAPPPASTSAMSDAAASATALSPSAQAPPALVVQVPPVQVPLTAAQQRPSAGSQALGAPTQDSVSRGATGKAAAPEQSPAAAGPAGRQAAPTASPSAPTPAQSGTPLDTPAEGAAGGTTGAALPPTALSAAPTVREGAAKRGDERAAKPGATAKEKAEAPALDVVDAFRLAWIVNAEAAAAKQADKDALVGPPWTVLARRDIDADGVVNQTDVDALLRELVKVPPVSPANAEASAIEVLFDIVLDTDQTPLAGYQVEIVGQGKSVRVVSIAAGTSVAFSEAPKYDGISLGLALGYGDSRMVRNFDASGKNSVELKSGMAPPEPEGSTTLRLAAVSLKPADQLPHGQVTVARVGWLAGDGPEPVMAVKLMAAVDATGERIKPKVKMERVRPLPVAPR